MSSHTPAPHGEATPPPHSPAEDASLIAKSFLNDLPVAFGAAERLIGVNALPLLISEQREGLKIIKLMGTEAFFPEIYDPVTEHARALQSGQTTVDAVRQAARHARNTLFITPGVYREFDGFIGTEGQEQPQSGFVVIGRDDERPDELCTYLFTAPEYSADPQAPGRAKLLLAMRIRGYESDEHRSKLSEWAAQHTDGNLAESAHLIHRLLFIDEQRYAEEILGMVTPDETGQPAAIGPATDGLIERYVSDLAMIAPEVPPSVLRAAAALLANSTGRHDVSDNALVSTGDRLPVIAEEAGQEAVPERSQPGPGKRVARHRRPTVREHTSN